MVEEWASLKCVRPTLLRLRHHRLAVLLSLKARRATLAPLAFGQSTWGFLEQKTAYSLVNTNQVQ